PLPLPQPPPPLKVGRVAVGHAAIFHGHLAPWMVALPGPLLCRVVDLDLRFAPLDQVIVCHASIVPGGLARMVAQRDLALALYRLAPMSGVLFHVLLAWFAQRLELPAQHPDTVPVEERIQQDGHRFDVLVGQCLAHEDVDDALRVAPLREVTLAPARLLLGIAQCHGPARGYLVTMDLPDI